MGRRLLLCLLLLGGCGGEPGSEVGTDMDSSERPGLASINVLSPAFRDGGEIPVDFTCDGQNISPPLQWTGVPEGAVELALIVDDPDAPSGTFNHWAVWGVPPEVSGVRAGERPASTRQGTNSFGRQNYSGPCPPRGQRHRYVFSVWALSRSPDLTPGAAADELRDAIRQISLGRGELSGYYAR